jgi:hypothetical protein
MRVGGLHHHAIILVSSLVAGSLILLIIIPQDPLIVPYVFFISYPRAFSLAYLSIYCLGFPPSVGRHVIVAIRTTLIYIILSIHRIPPCNNANNCLTQLFISLSHPK